MKIAWFTPFAQQSAIGKVSAEICDALSGTHEVDVWTPHHGDLHRTAADVVSFNGLPQKDKLAQYDFVVYNLGNFAGFHREILDVSRHFPGIVVLHDQTMSNFWGQYYMLAEFGGDPAQGAAAYVELFRRHYGEKAASLADKACKSGYFPVYDYPGMGGYDLIGPCIENSLGVFTHAGFFVDRLREISNVPMNYSYLPCKARDTAAASRGEIGKIIAKARAQGKKIVVSNGIVHPVKRIDRITAVLESDLSLAGKICYLVIGSCGGDYGEMLEKQSKTVLKDCLYMLGYQTDGEMNAAIAAADLCVNLRYPNSEVCSLSLLEQMSFYKPVMVLDSGIYGEMPDDAVIKLSLDNEEEGIRRTLIKLADGDPALDKAGRSAGAFIRENCTAKAYSDQFSSFLGQVRDGQAVAGLQNKVLQCIGNKMEECGITAKRLPVSYTMIVKKLGEVLGERQPLPRGRKVIGIWAGFKYKIPDLNREGISRFMSYMVTALLRNYDIDAEVWCYSFNEEEMKICFSQILNSSIKGRLSIITEANWKNIFRPKEDVAEQVGEINETLGNLADAARHVSRASVFLPMIVYLDDVIATDRKVFVPAHDMAMADHYDEFITEDPLYKARHLDILGRTENLARHGAVFFSNSDTVRKNQVLKYVKSLPEKNTTAVYLPVNIPDGIMDRLLEEKEIRKKFGIKGQYMYYPTQIRPYKNISTLIRALNQIKEEYPDLKLVLTGNPCDVPEVDELIREYKLTDRVVLVGPVTEQELYSLYQYTDVVPVSSLFEGGLPWQACEALYMNAPLVLSDIDVVTERMRFHGFEPEQSGVCLFNPMDDVALADGLRDILNDKKTTVDRQRRFAEALSAYDWNEAAKHYYQLFFDQDKEKRKA